MSTHVYLFKPQFAPLVEAGTKLQTVRPLRKRMPKAGDALSLRTWTGLPYRSKQRVLRETECIGVGFVDIEITRGLRFACESDWATTACREQFARNDGFSGWDELLMWFVATYNVTTFTGFVTYWQPLEAAK